MENKMTAVEWLVEHLGSNGFISTFESLKRDELNEIINQAMKMELEQGIEEYNRGYDNGYANGQMDLITD